MLDGHFSLKTQLSFEACTLFSRGAKHGVLDVELNYEMTKRDQIKVIRKFKNSRDPTSNRIDIVEKDLGVIGFLQPITDAALSDAALLEDITCWRQQNCGWFLTQFLATMERTRTWLSEVVLTDDQRLLFLIVDSRQERIGHVGLSGIDCKSAELDNVLRGRSALPARLMYYAQNTLIRWAHHVLGTRHLYLRVFADNSRAIAGYEALGFRQTAIIGLTRVERDSEVIYEETSNLNSNCERSLLRMTLDWKRFFAAR
jgi:RimJ/RimL family protein N-acetyltransferase